MNPVPQSCAQHPTLPDVPIEQWLSAKELAARFGLSPFSAYRWRSDGMIPPAFVKKSGDWFYKFHPAVIPVIEDVFSAAHLKRAADRAQPPRAGAAE
jgi:hypothetical protein